VVFETDCDEIKLQKYEIELQTITSPKDVTKFFPIWAPSNQNFWLRQW